MKLKILKEVVSDLAGRQASSIVDLLIDKKDVNEFKIAKKLGLTINQTRNILYRLYDFGLVSFIRKKDKKNGWYTYYWTLDTSKTLDFLKKKIRKDITQLQNQLRSRESKNFYVCKTCRVEISEENALLHDFTCPECGQVYELNDNSKIKKELNSKIISLMRETEIIDKELQKEKERKAKRKEKEKKAKKKTAKRKATKKKVKRKAKKKEKKVTKKKRAKKKQKKSTKKGKKKK